MPCWGLWGALCYLLARYGVHPSPAPSHTHQASSPAHQLTSLPARPASQHDQRASTTSEPARPVHQSTSPPVHPCTMMVHRPAHQSTMLQCNTHAPDWCICTMSVHQCTSLVHAPNWCMPCFGADSPLFSPATPLFLDPLPFRPGP